MKKFALGFAVCWVFFVKYRPETTKFLQDTLAKLELKRDLIQHDNPDL